MKLKTVAPGRGWQWTRLGLRAFAKRPMSFALLFSSVMGLVVLVDWVPLLAFVIVPVVPLLSLGFMIATRTVLDGGFPTPRVFVVPLQLDRSRRLAHLKLGMLYTASTFAITGLVALVDSGGPPTSLEAAPVAASAPASRGASGAAAPADTVGAPSAADASAALAASPDALSGVVLRFALASLLAIPFWHAPALVHWGGQGCAQALFSSTLGCWRNRGALVIYLMSWFGLVLGCSVIGSVVLMLFGQPQWVMGTIVSLALAVGTMFYASLYFTFAECFVGADGETLDAPVGPRSSPESSS